MRIDEYFVAVRATIASCPFVDLYTITCSERGDYEGFIRGDILFLDGTHLHLREYVDVRSGVVKHLYAYHYERENGRLVFRYDNASHHRRLNLATFPHHKHQDTEANVVASLEPDLTQVLNEIESLVFSAWRKEIPISSETVEPIHDSASSWVKKHIDDYVATDGQTGHEWRPNVPTLLLTTRGRKSGSLRRSALIYGQDEDNYLVVASKGGDARHPAWYLNLAVNPEVNVQVKGEKFTATATTASAEEKPRLWAIMEKIWPAYNDYQAKTERDIPVVILKPHQK